jgi:hypothetical protein
MSTASLRQRGSLACLAATALLISACAGSSSSGASAQANSTTSAPVAATAGSAGSTAAKTSAAPAAAAVTSVKATGGGEFCKNLAAAINSNALTSGGTTPADLKKSIQASEAVGLKALLKAPSAIKADVKVLIDASTQLFSALEKVNYDFTKITPADEAVFSSPAVTAAEKRVDVFVKADCGIDIGGGAAASS